MTDDDEKEGTYIGRPRWLADLKVRFGQWIEERRRED